MARHNDIGHTGEEQAKLYLESQGYRILEQNWRHNRYEVDLIAEKGELLVFVEVKTRTHLRFGDPEVFVNKAKQQNVVSAADAYITQKKLDKEARFDIIAICRQRERYDVKHIVAAYYPRLR